MQCRVSRFKHEHRDAKGSACYELAPLHDISFAADAFCAGFEVWDGVPGPGADGTSFSAPIFSAMQAEIDQRQQQRKGNIAGRLYALWSTYGYAPFYPGQPAIFYDITQVDTGWKAAAGWDAASGIGTVDGWALSSTE